MTRDPFDASPPRSAIRNAEQRFESDQILWPPGWPKGSDLDYCRAWAFGHMFVIERKSVESAAWRDIRVGVLQLRMLSESFAMYGVAGLLVYQRGAHTTEITNETVVWIADTRTLPYAGERRNVRIPREAFAEITGAQLVCGALAWKRQAQDCCPDHLMSLVDGAGPFPAGWTFAEFEL